MGIDKKMDERFRAVLTDPRFRRQKKKETRVQIDSRFSQVLQSGKNNKKNKKNKEEKADSNNKNNIVSDFTAEDFAITASVDRYGRAITSTS